jgi:Pyruvate/2-oxoacid:ferredoxin oxidoreductase delta subunit
LFRKKQQITFALKFWWLTHVAKRIGHLTPFKQIAGLIVSDKVFRASFIPIREEIEVPPGMVAPREILRDYITRASHRTISYRCPCRSGEGCRNHPPDLGCMLLGDAAKTVNPDVGYSATVEEGLAYLDRALERGLLPMIGHVRIDRYVFGAKPFNRLLTLCFCCECCCFVRSGMRGLFDAYPKSMARLEGVKVELTGECAGCGECLPVCPIENVRLIDGTAEIGDRCLGCGTCAATCKQGCISVTIEPGSSMHEELKRRVEAGVDIE